MAATSFLAALGAKYPDSKLLFADDFTDGFDGWTELYESGTSTPRPPLSRVTFPAMSGGYALRLGTGAVAVSAKDGFAEAIKRMTRPMTFAGADTGIVNFDLFWSWGATLAILAPQQIEFGCDTQSWDGTTRNLFKVRWQTRDSSTGAQKMQWGIANNAGTIVDVPSATFQYPFNENKQNYQYTRIRLDLVNGYKGLWSNNQFFDLSGLGAGTGSTSTVANFNGGMNFYVAIYNRTASNLCQAWVDIDQCRGWFE